MNILKGLGIIAVVLGHKYYPFGDFFHPYQYHMALFFFISGYFYKAVVENNLSSYIFKKAKNLLGLYFIYNAIYALITIFLYKQFDILLGSLPDFFNFFVGPFINGHQYALSLAMWFVCQLFITQIVFAIINKILGATKAGPHLKLLIFFSIGLAGAYLATKGYNSDQYINIAIRTLYSLFFFYFGFYYKAVLEKKNIFNGFGLIVVLTIEGVLISLNVPLRYGVVWSNYFGQILLPFFAGILGIYLQIFLAKAIDKFSPRVDILERLGAQSFHIMANHLFVFFAINFAYLKIKGVDVSTLSNVWFAVDVEKYWIVYVAFGLFLPMLIAETIVGRISRKNKTGV